MIADDWLSAAADQAHRHLLDSLRPRFGSKRWKEFGGRLDQHFERLFRLLHRLYGWQYDFAWTVESLAGVAATGYLERPPRLRRADRRAEGQAPAWITDPATTWALASPDRLAEDPAAQIELLASLGVTHLLLSSPLAAVLETVEAMDELAESLQDAGIALVVDFDCNHTHSDHPWAQSAAVGGPEAGYYFLSPDRSTPDRYAPHLRTINPERGGDAFTWHPEVQGGRWVWTTFESDQWDLDYSNPRVLAAIAAEMLSVANLGTGAIRLGSLPFLWKSEGTSSENLPEAHVVVQVLRVLADLAAPSVAFASGLNTAAAEITSFVDADECRLGQNPSLMSSIWEAIATSDTRLLRVALQDLGRFPEGCAGLSYLLADQPLEWDFAEAEAIRLGIDPVLHRQYLNSFYPDEVRENGTPAALAGLDTATEEMDPVKVDLAIHRLLAAWAVVVAAGGIPLLRLDDGMVPPTDLSPEAQVLAGVKRLLAARRALTGVYPNTSMEIVESGHNGVLAFRREDSLLAVNLTAQSALIVRESFPVGAYFDLIGEEVWDGHVLGAYECRFVQL